MYPNSDLEMLMARYQQGDFTAATALVHRLSPQLHRFFVVQFASREDADDLLQETWLRIHEARHTYRAGEPVLPWFYAIARHIRVDHYRSGGGACGGIRRNAGSGSAPGVPSGEPAGGDRDVESRRDVPGGGGARHFIERWIGEAESASGV
jgi:RNA polymerase sigma-70 factor (ECF subfamily)